jgi:hypothetical protein
MTPDLSENLIQHTGAVKALYPTLLTSAVRADFGIDDLPAGRYLEEQIDSLRPTRWSATSVRIANP